MSQNNLYTVLLSPVVSEKSVFAAEDHNTHVFKVAPEATKLDIKNAVESLLNVKVDNVRVVNVKGKTKRFGARQGKRSDVRKAYVRLAEGESLQSATTS